jgi:hypothetical protein
MLGGSDRALILGSHLQDAAGEKLCLARNSSSGGEEKFTCEPLADVAEKFRSVISIKTSFHRIDLGVFLESGMWNSTLIVESDLAVTAICCGGDGAGW